MKKTSYQSRDISIKYAKGDTDIYGRYFHSYHEIFLLLNGDVEFIGSSLRTKVKPFDLFLIPKGDYHQFSVLSDIENYERCVIDIRKSIVYGEIESLFEKRSILSLNKNHRIVRNIEYLLSAMSVMSKADYDVLLNSVVTDILLEIKYSPKKSTELEKFDNLPMRLIDSLDRNYTTDVTLEALAKENYCSVSQICHIFKKSFGISIKQYLLQKRMEIAREKIKNGIDIKTVSENVGYTDYVTFYRAYKKYFGVSPREHK